MIHLLKINDNVVGESDSSIAECCGVIVVIPDDKVKEELIEKVNEILSTKEKINIFDNKEKFAKAVETIVNDANNNLI